LAAAFGCAYVLEGATLGGRTMLPLVETRLHLTAQHGAAYLASYGADVSRRWAEFGTALNAWCHEPLRRASTVQAATRTFDALTEWLCGSRHE
jgi:heme oxygenase